MCRIGEEGLFLGECAFCILTSAEHLLHEFLDVGAKAGFPMSGPRYIDDGAIGDHKTAGVGGVMWITCAKLQIPSMRSGPKAEVQQG